MALQSLQATYPFLNVTVDAVTTTLTTPWIPIPEHMCYFQLYGASTSILGTITIHTSNTDSIFAFPVGSWFTSVTGAIVSSLAVAGGAGGSAYATAVSYNGAAPFCRFNFARTGGSAILTVAAYTKPL